DVAADVAIDAELGFAMEPVAIVVPSDFDRERRAVDAGESSGVKDRGHVTDLAGLEGLFLNGGRSPTPPGPDAEQFNVLLVDIFGSELKGRIGAAGDGAEVVLSFGEQFCRPSFGETRAGRSGQ